MGNRMVIFLMFFTFVLLVKIHAQFDIDRFDSDWEENFEFPRYGFVYDQNMDAITYQSANRNGVSLYLKNEVLDSAEWTIEYSYDQIYGSTNYLRYYLSSETNNFQNSRSFFVECVNSSNTLRLCEYTEDGVEVQILSCKLSVSEGDDIDRIKLRIVRSCKGEWDLYSSINSSAEQRSSAFYTSYFSSKYAGLRVRMNESNPSLIAIHSMSANGVARCGDIPEEPDDSVVIGSASIHSIVFSEIMADPDPVIGLPEVEYIEIYNRSSENINLAGCKLYVGSAYGELYPFELAPKTYAILCSENKKIEMSAYKNLVLVKSFKTLINDGRLVYLTSADGELITWIDYKKEWYGNEFKEDGGYSLERIDNDNLHITGDNFSASMNIHGGTPGVLNSICASNPDGVEPKVIDAYITKDNRVQILFNKEMRVGKDNFESEECDVDEMEVNNPYSDCVIMPIVDFSDSVIFVSLISLKCVTGYSLQDTIIELKPLKQPKEYDLMFSEVMFDPEKKSPKYIEVYNNSDDYISIVDLYVEKYDEYGDKNVQLKINSLVKGIAPDSYCVVVVDQKDFKASYDYCDNAVLGTINSDVLLKDGGSIALKSMLGELVLDSIAYGEYMHNPWIEDNEGVSLEKINLGEGEFLASNWTSATSASGYSTPGCENSHNADLDVPDNDTKKKFYVENETFTPNNDAYQDVLNIYYDLDKSGFVCSVKIYSPSGQYITDLLDEDILSQSGKIVWRGTTIDGRPLPIGIYVIVVEAIHSEGEIINERIVSVIAS